MSVPGQATSGRTVAQMLNWQRQQMKVAQWPDYDVRWTNEAAIQNPIEASKSSTSSWPLTLSAVLSPGPAVKP